jgi:long-chain acyl-CoA synthetase
MSLVGPPLPPPTPLRDLLSRGLRGEPDTAALSTAETSLSWAELHHRTGILAASYRGLGLRPGDRVASLLPNRLDAVLHVLACIRAGLVATPLNYRYRCPEIDRALKLSGARWLLFHAERQGDVDGCRERNGLDLGCLRVVDGMDGRLADQVDFATAGRNAGAGDPSAAAAEEPFAADAPALIFFTSGSTGVPKGVTHDRRSLEALINAYGRNFHLTGADRYLIASSMAHIGGLLGCLSSLTLGTPVFVARSSDAAELAQMLLAFRPTVVKMLPSTLFSLVRDPQVPGDAFASLRECCVAGDHVPSELHGEVRQRTGHHITEMYAMTEAGMLAANRGGDADRIGSVGPPAVGVELQIRGDDGRPLPAGETGDLWARTPCAMQGYWRDPTATAEVLVEGWLATGDRMRADADGVLWFAGRRRQIIVHDGSNICPQEVEDALLEHPAVTGAVAIGIHDLVHGENVRAYVTLHAGARAPAEAELIAFTRARIGYKAPTSIVVLDRLPLNATGKVDRPAIRALAQSAPGLPPAAAVPGRITA